MSPAVLGIALALVFVLLEALQFVYFGGLFQRMGSFLFGALVFGLATVWSLAVTSWRSPEQIRAALCAPVLLIFVNLGAVLTLTAYLLSVQLVEPAVTYAISAGAMPLTAFAFYLCGVTGGEPLRNKLEVLGAVLLALAILCLAAITLAGWSGFMRGSWWSGLAGVGLAIVDGAAFTWVLVQSRRLNDLGVGPVAVLGLRLPLYVLVAAGGAAVGLDAKEPLAVSEVLVFAAVGFTLTVPPLYALQRAVAMISTLTVSALTALGPFVIFLLQMVEGRVDYAPATLAGLALYVAGALCAALGAVRATARPQ